MMSILTQEDNKIALLTASQNHIYDPEQINDVLNEFYLARNKQKAAEIIEAGR
jgi:chorismate mutase